MPLKSNKRHLKGLSCFFPPFPCQHTHLQSGSSITAEQRGKLDTCWENGFCWRGTEKKIPLMDLVKVKKRRKCKFIPYNYKYFSYWWTDCRRICSYGCDYILKIWIYNSNQVKKTTYQRDWMIAIISSIIMIICLLSLRKKLSSVYIHHLTWAHKCRITCTCCCLSRAREIKHEVMVGSYTSTCCPVAQCVVLLLAFDPHPHLHQRKHHFNAFQPPSFLSKNLICCRLTDRWTDGR